MAVTTDNASNNITFLQSVEDSCAIDHIQFEMENQHVRCVAHVINLAVQKALKSLNIIEDRTEVELLELEFQEQHSGTGSLLQKVCIYLLLLT